MNDKQFIKADLYAVVDVLAMLAIIILALSAKKKNETLLIGSAFVGILALATIIIQAKFGQTMVKNNSNQTIYIKPEETTEPVAVPPHSDCYDIDGIKANGKVYKLPDGVHATVKDGGKVKVLSITGRLIYTLIGGLLQTSPDGGWQKLFDK